MLKHPKWQWVNISSLWVQGFSLHISFYKFAWGPHRKQNILKAKLKWDVNLWINLHFAKNKGKKKKIKSKLMNTWAAQACCHPRVKIIAHARFQENCKKQLWVLWDGKSFISDKTQPIRRFLTNLLIGRGQTMIPYAEVFGKVEWKWNLFFDTKWLRPLF